MKKILFIALFGILFLAACSNQKKSIDSSSQETTEQVQDSSFNVSEENEGAIDDSGEVLQDSTDEVEPE